MNRLEKIIAVGLMASTLAPGCSSFKKFFHKEEPIQIEHTIKSMPLEIFIKIYGRVHGVGFRYSAKRIAQKLALTGTVRNASDGTVEIIAQGQKP